MKLKSKKTKRLTAQQLIIIEVLASIMFIYLLYATIKPILMGVGCLGYALFVLWVWMDFIMLIEREKRKRR